MFGRYEAAWLPHDLPRRHLGRRLPGGPEKGKVIAFTIEWRRSVSNVVAVALLFV
jgi:hypothetical protein